MTGIPDGMQDKKIECEIRSFISPEEFPILLERLKKEADYLGEDRQITSYFEGAHDLRIQKNLTGGKIWCKGGRMHDDHREEVEIKLDEKGYAEAEKLFAILGYTVEIKWFRTRHSFELNGVSIALDDTKGYGHIIELEMVCSQGEEAVVLERLRTQLKELGISETPKEAFRKRFERYRTDWRRLLGELKE